MLGTGDGASDRSAGAGRAPMIFTGLRLSLQASWTTLVAAELVGALAGLGRVLNMAPQDIYPAMIMVGMAASASRLGDDAAAGGGRAAGDAVACRLEIETRPTWPAPHSAHCRNSKSLFSARSAYCAFLGLWLAVFDVRPRAAAVPADAAWRWSARASTC